MINKYKIGETPLNKDNRLTVGITKDFDSSEYVVCLIDADATGIVNMLSFPSFDVMRGYLQKIKPDMIWCEAYGYASYWGENLMMYRLPVRLFKMSKRSKSSIYEQLIRAVNNGLTLLANRHLMDQLLSLEVEYSKTGLQYIRMQDHHNDEHVLACALAWHGANYKTYFRVDFA